MRRDLRLLRLWLGLGLSLVAVVWGLSLMPAPPVAGVAGSDKLGHLLAYAIQTLWFCWLVEPPAQRWVGLWFVVQGAVLELLQVWVALRSPDLADVAANSLGVVLGMVAGRWSAGFLCLIERPIPGLASRRGPD